jgi:hypothetical protein
MKQRILSMALLPEGEPIYSERGYTVSIEDEAAGEYLKLSNGQDENNCITFEAGDWPLIRGLVNRMAKEVRE